MSLSKFEPATVTLSKDLLHIKESAGGQAGVLKVGNEKITVLRYGMNVYATTDKVSPLISSLVNLDKADIHSIKNNADRVRFLDRWKIFNQGI